jgi:ketosteroid isomerase-like protein
MKRDRRTRLAILIPLLFVCLGCSVALRAAPAKQDAASSAENLAPLNEWATTVNSGNRAALARFYSTTPAAQTKTSTETITDPSEEPAFWTALAAKGISNVDPKILEIERPNPSMVVLVLRIEFDLSDAGAKKPFIVSAAQVWIKEADGWKIGLTQRGDVEPRPVERLPEPAKPNVDLYPAPEDAAPEIRNALAAAAKDHKRVILVFGGNWCYDCHVLDAAFRSRELAPIVEANYHLVHVNIGDMDKNLDVAKKYQVPLDKGVPVLAVLDPNGTVVFSQQHGEFESSVKIGPEDVTAFLEKWKPAGN